MSQHIHKTDSLQGSSASERVVSVRRKRWLEMKFGGGGGGPLYVLFPEKGVHDN